MWKSNEKNIFHISFPTLACRSEDILRGSSSIIAQSLKTLQQSGSQDKKYFKQE